MFDWAIISKMKVFQCLNQKEKMEGSARDFIQESGKNESAGKF